MITRQDFHRPTISRDHRATNYYSAFKTIERFRNSTKHIRIQLLIRQHYVCSLDAYLRLSCFAHL